MRMQKFNVSAAAVRIIRGLRLSLSRPLFVVLAGITAAIWAAELVFPCRLVDYEAIRGEEIELTGTVSALDQKMEGEDLVWKMVLKDVEIRNILALKDPGRSGFFENVSVSENPKENGSAGLYFDNVEDTIPGVVCILDEEPPVDISSRVLVRGTAYPFRGAMNEGEFDIRMYYHILNIEFSVRDVELLAVSRKEDHVSAALYHLKRRLSESIDAGFSEQNAPVMKAMLLGEKGMLDQETRELYKGAGIIHVLSISGMHMSLIGMSIFSLLKKIRVPLPVRAGISILLIFLYGKMVGMGTSTYRALIMLSLYILSGVFGRTYDLFTAAGIASVLLLLEQPLYLKHTGFLFSFSAILAIGIMVPALPGRILKGLAIPLFTLPVYLYNYGVFPVYSLLLNLVIIPLMPVAMLSGVCTAGAECILDAETTAPGLLHRILHIAGFPAEWILDLYRILADASAGLPGSQIVTGRPSGVQILVYYGMLLGLAAVSARLQLPHIRKKIENYCLCNNVAPGSGVAGKVESRFFLDKTFLDKNGKKHVFRMPYIFRLPQDNRERRKAASICAGLWMSFAVVILTYRSQVPFEMDVLYVGQGDGIVVSCEGRHFLIDGGSSTSWELADYTLIPFLHCRGISRLDGVIMTHDDIDHCSGLLDLLEKAASGKPAIQIGSVYLPAIAEHSKGERYRRIEELSRTAAIPVSYISRGQRIRTGSLTMDCFHPKAGASYVSANEYSTTLLLHYKDRFTALLTGDLEGEGEQDLLEYLEQETDALHVDLLKTAHHGSKGATSENFLEAVHAYYAVISAGIDNMYGHPHQELLKRLDNSNIPYDRTDRSGMIRITEGKSGIRYQPFLKERKGY